MHCVGEVKESIQSEVRVDFEREIPGVTAATKPSQLASKAFHQLDLKPMDQDMLQPLLRPGSFMILRETLCPGTRSPRGEELGNNGAKRQQAQDRTRAASWLLPPLAPGGRNQPVPGPPLPFCALLGCLVWLQPTKPQLFPGDKSSSELALQNSPTSGLEGKL